MMIWIPAGWTEKFYCPLTGMAVECYIDIGKIGESDIVV